MFLLLAFEFKSWSGKLYSDNSYGLWYIFVAIMFYCLPFALHLCFIIQLQFYHKSATYVTFQYNFHSRINPSTNFSISLIIFNLEPYI